MTFSVGQKVWCVLFGPGTVTEVNNKTISKYSNIAVKFARNGTVATFTPDGRPNIKADVCLYPYPVKVVRDDEPKKPSINWEHVSSEFNYLAEDADGGVFLYEDKPYTTTETWMVASGDLVEAHILASYTKGTCDWQDSLVKRPEGET